MVTKGATKGMGYGDKQAIFLASYKEIIQLEFLFEMTLKESGGINI